MMREFAPTALLAGIAAVAFAAAADMPGDAAVTSSRIVRAGFVFEDVALRFDWTDITRPALELRAARVVLPGPLGELNALELHCPALVISAPRLRCAAGTLEARHADVGAVNASITFEYTPDGALRLTASTSAVVGGTLDAELRSDGDGIHLAVRGRELALGGAVDATLASLDVDLRQPAAPHAAWQADARFAGLGFSNPSGTLAGEALDGRLTLTARAAPDGHSWAGRARIVLTQGGAYAEPVYLDLARFPVTVVSDYRFADPRFELTQLDFEQPGVLEIAGHALDFVDGALVTADVAVESMRFPAAYDAWLAGYLVGTPFARLDIAGSLSGRVRMEAGALSAIDVALDALDLEDRDGRLALYGLDGEVHWAADGTDLAASVLGLEGGFFYGAGFDATEFVLGIAGAAIDLLEPARIPLLGGALTIEQFSLRDYGSDELALGLEAALEPIDLGQLTLALDWPAFAGTLSGRLPLLSYRDGVVTLGGDLEARAFDGDITIGGLRIARPLGLVPEIEADIRMRNLDLAQITEVVPFGRITGRLDADIDNLRMLKGEPVRFDARFRTPADDDSRHLLSQRAVDTISRVAGGGGAVLSTTFLRVFENFAYERLGISCRLENDVCHMDGIEPADDGYYIVKGAWLPRVDLIGRVHRVHWSRLMAQLEQALAEGEFRIE
ncbi:MAG: hypothetical protein RLW61_21880 [Gammaproteobacteria bacterium]